MLQQQQKHKKEGFVSPLCVHANTNTSKFSTNSNLNQSLPFTPFFFKFEPAFLHFLVLFSSFFASTIYLVGRILFLCWKCSKYR